jgi:hypothetical protein
MTETPITCDRCQETSTIQVRLIWLLHLGFAECRPTHSHALFLCPRCREIACQRIVVPKLADVYAANGAVVSVVDPAAHHPSRGGA